MPRTYFRDFKYHSMLTSATLVRVHIYIAMARDIALTFEGNSSSLCNGEKQYIRF